MNKKEAREIFISSIIGDGSLSKHSQHNTYKFYIGHGEDQLDYLVWKVSLLNKTKLFKKPLKIESKIIKLNNKEYLQYFTTQTSKDFRIYYNWSRSCGKKSILKLLKYLNTPLSLAIWFMDDGSVFKRKRKHKDGSIYYLKPSMKLCTHSFNLNDNQKILEWLKDNFNIEGYVVIERKRNRDTQPEYYTLNFNSDNTKKIWDLIKPYVKTKSMKDKFAFLINYYQ